MLSKNDIFFSKFSLSIERKGIIVVIWGIFSENTLEKKFMRRGSMAKYIMALDAGTTSNRCILFNEQGDMCSVAQKEFTQYFPKPGWVEHDADEIWSTQYEVAHQAMANINATAAEIAAIGITNQRETVVVWDKIVCFVFHFWNFSYTFML